MSAADGYARATGKPQCVLVHVDVGTNALGQALHNACSGKAPVLIFAGQAPYTLEGELPGSRSEQYVFGSVKSKGDVLIDRTVCNGTKTSQTSMLWLRRLQATATRSKLANTFSSW